MEVLGLLQHLVGWGLGKPSPPLRNKKIVQNGTRWRRSPKRNFPWRNKIRRRFWRFQFSPWGIRCFRRRKIAFHVNIWNLNGTGDDAIFSDHLTRLVVWFIKSDKWPKYWDILRCHSSPWTCTVMIIDNLLVELYTIFILPRYQFHLRCQQC